MINILFIENIFDYKNILSNMFFVEIVNEKDVIKANIF